MAVLTYILYIFYTTGLILQKKVEMKPWEIKFIYTYPMKYVIDISQELIIEIFEKTLNLDPKYRTIFFNDLRKGFNDLIEKLLNSQGIKVNEKAVKSLQYKHNRDYRNYLYDNNYCEIPSLLPFVKNNELSIGDITSFVQNGNYTIDVNLPESISRFGTTVDISSRKKYSYFTLVDVKVKTKYLKSVFEKYHYNCKCNNSDLDEIRIGVMEYPTIFICRKCGKLYICNCFKNHVEHPINLNLLGTGIFSEFLNDYIQRNTEFRTGICHLCTRGIPKLEYGSELYYSIFLRKYLPYYKLFCNKNDDNSYDNKCNVYRQKLDELSHKIESFIHKHIKEGTEQSLFKTAILPPKIVEERKINLNFEVDNNHDSIAKNILKNYTESIHSVLLNEYKKGKSVLKGKLKEFIEKYHNTDKDYNDLIRTYHNNIENDLRDYFEYPKIGEKWITETTLFKIVDMVLSDKEVIHHYRGSELERLEIDIWIPELKLGIEYQGEQHYKSIEHWGGEEGLKQRKERDKKKKKLCKELGYKLIEFKFDEDISVENVERKLKKIF